MRNKIIFLIIILAVAATGFKIVGSLPDQKKQPTENKTQTQVLKVVSTKPDPLEGATILATQDIEIILSRPVFVGQLLIKFDPEVEYNIETVNQVKSNISDRFKITFKKPLSLGSGYSLVIKSETQTEDGQRIDKEYIYHFKTIEYKGV